MFKQRITCHISGVLDALPQFDFDSILFWPLFDCLFTLLDFGWAFVYNPAVAEVKAMLVKLSHFLTGVLKAWEL